MTDEKKYSVGIVERHGDSTIFFKIGHQTFYLDSATYCENIEEAEFFARKLDLALDILANPIKSENK